MEEKTVIYIIGAGVSGLIAAYELERAGYHPIVLEKTAEVGGRVKTIREKGYDLDLGFQVLLSAYPLATTYLDMEALQLRQLESGALIYTEGRAYQIGDPLRNWKVFVPTFLARVGSLTDKLRIFKLNRRLQAKTIEEIFASPETSTYDYLLDLGFSEKIIERFFRPFFAGIFLEPDLRTSSRMFEFVYKMFGEGYATIPASGIGAISAQLKAKLKKTQFRFNCEVKEVTNEEIHLRNGERIAHEGLILSHDASRFLRNMTGQDVEWKSCMCLYFEVDRINIPKDTIALLADKDSYANNLYAYTDRTSGKTVLSVTSLRQQGKSDQELIEKISEEVKRLTSARELHFIHSYRIDQALPDIQDLKATVQASECQLLDNVFLAGDYLLNGSLNAAMESGRLAAKAAVEKRKGIKA